MQDEHQTPEERALHEHARRRSRRFWTWLAFVPAPACLVVFWTEVLRIHPTDNSEATFTIALILSSAWVIFCAQRIVFTWQTSPGKKWLGGTGLALLFATLNAALFWGLLLASCVVLSQGWH